MRLGRANLCRAAGKRRRKEPNPLSGPTTTAVKGTPSTCSDAVVVRVLKREPQSVLEQLDPVGAFTCLRDDLHVIPSARLSRLLMRQWLLSFYRGNEMHPKLGDAGRPLASIVSRWLAYARYSALLSPQDLTSMVHGSAFITGLPLKQEDGGKALLRLHERSDAQHDGGHCDGRVCGGMCLGPRRLLAGKPVHFDFTGSPVEPIDDSDLNNFPALAFRHEETEELQRLQRFVETDFAVDSQWPGAAVGYRVVVRVNRAFERLFGWSQRQVRSMYQQHSFFALFQLFAPREWQRVMRMEVAVELGTSSEYEGSYQLRTRGRHYAGSEFDCCLHKTYERDDHGIVVKGYFTWIADKQSETTTIDHTA